MGAWQERRSFFRVEGRVYLNYRKVAEEEKEDLLNEMHAQEIVFAGGSLEAGGQDIEDPVLQCLDIRLQRIEEKLDLLLGRSDYRRGVEKKDLSLTPCVVSISGSGIRFPTRERFKAGDLLEVMVMLPIMPDHFIRLLGEVVHTLKRMDRKGANEIPYDTAVKFVSVLEEDQERIVRFTFLRQTQEIRARRCGSLSSQSKDVG
jgi:hypothetical protein